MTVGRLIALEGGEGSGKTTVWKRLKKDLMRSGRFLFCREPGGTEFGEEIRDILFSRQYDMLPETEFMLFMVSRLELFNKVIRPALARGRHVVTDRLDASTFVYQIYAHGLREFEELFRVVQRRYLKPIGDEDWLCPHYILLDLDPEIGLKRRQTAGDTNRFDEKEIKFHHTVRSGYKHFVARERDHTIIDASLSPDEVFKSALDVVLKLTEEGV